jgi:hypothetical protein
VVPHLVFLSHCPETHGGKDSGRGDINRPKTCSPATDILLARMRVSLEGAAGWPFTPRILRDFEKARAECF